MKSETSTAPAPAVTRPRQRLAACTSRAAQDRVLKRILDREDAVEVASFSSSV